MTGMGRYYVSIPYGWLEANSPRSAVERVIADDSRTDHEGVTFLVREEGADRLVLIVIGDDDPTPVRQAAMDDWEYLYE